MSTNRSGLFLHLLQKKLAEGMSFAEATEWALAGVQEAYDVIKESVLGPRALTGRRSAGYHRAA